MTGFINSFKNLFVSQNKSDDGNTNYFKEQQDVKALYTSSINNEEVGKLNKRFDLKKQNQTIYSYLADKEKIYYVIDEGVNEKTKEGTAIITDYCFHFKENEKTTSDRPLDIKIPVFLINKIKEVEDKIVAFYILEFWTRDNRHLKFKVFTDKKSFYNTLFNRAFPKKSNSEFSIYASEYAKLEQYQPNRLETSQNGWYIYIPELEFKRQELDTKRFQLSKINENYSICHSYPEELVTVKNVKKEKIIEAAGFRTKNRFPVVCFYNKLNKTALLRSSQTKTGFNIGNFNRSEADESYLENVREENEVLDIFDARPYLNAFANKFKGAGFENTSNYKNTNIHFCEIENIHYVRNCFEKQQKLFSNEKLWEDKSFYSGLEAAGWMEMTSIILTKTIDIVKSLSKNSVLIHCSDGWDRTSQLTALTELLMDPFYRTLKGFCILIEKEWISYGHMFAYRNGFHVEELSENNYSQIFIQFLDCVYQIMTQFPDQFEFNINLLEYLSYHLYTGRYGTFLYNNERDRETAKAKTTTVSIWTDILLKLNLKSIQKSFYNPFYDTTIDVTKLSIIYPQTYMFNIQIWEEYFLRNNLINETNLGYWTLGDKHESGYFNSMAFYLDDKKTMDKEIDKKENKIKEIKEAIKDLIEKAELDIKGLENIEGFELIKDILV